MNDIAIHVEGLGKQYRIGAARAPYKTLRESLVQAFQSPFRRLRQGFQPSNADNTFWALRDVSFDVKRGEVVGIIGRNGAGKSTLLKILSRITGPTEGLADIYGRVGSLLEVGTGFHPELTGRENIYLNGAILGMKRAEIERKFDEIVDFAEVEKFIDTPVKRYSSGMYVRLAFAVAAHLEPDILMVDEVLSVGDAAFQKKCLGKMGDVAKEGRTVLFVSHNMTAISQLCSQCILLNQGEVINYASTEEVIHQYLNRISVTNPGDLETQVHSLRPDDVFTLHLIKVFPGNSNNSQTEFLTHLPIVLEMVYEIKKPESNLRIGFDIISADGVLLFRSFDDDLEVVCREPGYYHSRCIIPGNWLTVGEYLLTLAIGIHNMRWIIYRDIWINIPVTQTDGVNRHYMDTHKRPGYLLPALEWQIDPVEYEAPFPGEL